MACAIEHHTAVSKAWSVGNGHCGQGDSFACGLHGQRFAQCLNTIEHASGCACGDGYLLVVHAKTVSLGTSNFGIDGQNDGGSLLVALVKHSGFYARGLLYVLGEEAGIAFHLGIGTFVHDGCGVREVEGQPFCHHNTLWQRHNIIVGVGCMGA